MRNTLLFGVLFLAPLLANAARAELSVSIDFPGGSGAVQQIDQQHRTIALRPTKHKGKGWECWWFVRISGIKPGESLQIIVGDAPWATPNQAAISEDGSVWRQTAIGRRTGKRITYRIETTANAMYVAWGPPFTPVAAKSLIDRAAKRDHVMAFKLCTTRGNRAVWALHFKRSMKDVQIGKSPKFGIWVQARQHAWESGSSWVCKGLVDWLTAESKESQWLRRRADIFVVPIMDVDNVAIGAGGKNQVPHDHNRDWLKQPHWRSVEAAQARIQALDAAGHFHLFVDLHNPGATARRPYFYLTPRNLLEPVGQLNLDRFLAAVRRDMTGPLEFQGETYESGPGYDANWQSISKNWVSQHTREHVVAVTLETAWNTPHSNQKGYQAVGRQLGLAISRHLRTTPQPPR